MRFLVVFSEHADNPLHGRICDYSICCGVRPVEMEAPSKEALIERLRADFHAAYSGECGSLPWQGYDNWVARLRIYPVTGHDDVNFGKWLDDERAAVEAAKADKAAEAERAEYERLKARYG